MPRKPKPLSTRQVELLAAKGLTIADIADVCGVSRDTIERRARGAVERGRLNLRMKLRQKQIQVAMRGSAAMLRWLGIQYLGQRAQVEQVATVTVRDGDVKPEDLEAMKRQAFSAEEFRRALLETMKVNTGFLLGAGAGEASPAVEPYAANTPGDRRGQ